MNRFFSGVDWVLLLSAVLIVFFGLAAIYSLEPVFFRQQFFFLIAGIVLFITISKLFIPKVNGVWAGVYIGINLALLLTLILGVEVKGAIRWIEIFNIRVQTSEFIKIFYILFLSYFLTRNDKHSLEKFLSVLVLSAPVAFFILRGPDLGNALIIALLTLFMLFAYGFPTRFFAALLIPAMIIVPIAYRFLHDYQKLRITSFLNMSQDPFGSSYNAIQALIAIGSGGIMGKGFGQSTQSVLHFLPEQHTDFIFATILESLGLIGGVILLILYSFMFVRIYKISVHAETQFARMVLMGSFFLLLTHLFFNMGMNIGLLPIVGVTLPLVSYGGSSLLTNFLILGIISNISSRKTTRLLEIS